MKKQGQTGHRTAIDRFIQTNRNKKSYLGRQKNREPEKRGKITSNIGERHDSRKIFDKKVATNLH